QPLEQLRDPRQIVADTEGLGVILERHLQRVFGNIDADIAHRSSDAGGCRTGTDTGNRGLGRTVHDWFPTLQIRARRAGRSSPARAVVRAKIKKSGTILLGFGLRTPEGCSICARPLARGL